MTPNNVMHYQLKDQSCIQLELVGPHCREQYLNGFAHISRQTNINRFHSFKHGFSEAELKYLLDVDNINHLAIGAIDCDKPELGIGLARYVRQTTNPVMAEAAIVVIDEYQHRGLGHILYAELIHYANQNGIQHLLNYVKKDNRDMLALLKSFNALKVAESDYHFELVTDTQNKLLKTA